MIIQLFTKLKEAEALGAAALKAAEAVHDAGVKAGKHDGELSALDPGRHQIALGSVRTAIAFVENILGPQATTAARNEIAAEQSAQALEQAAAQRVTEVSGQ
jgi:hypothetical protein